MLVSHVALNILFRSREYIVVLLTATQCGSGFKWGRPVSIDDTDGLYYRAVESAEDTPSVDNERKYGMIGTFQLQYG